MENFLREERLIEPPEVQLEHASDGVHVMVILVPSQRILACRGQWRAQVNSWTASDLY